MHSLVIKLGLKEILKLLALYIYLFILILIMRGNRHEIFQECYHFFGQTQHILLIRYILMT